MDENGEILQLHASKNNARPLVLPCALYTLIYLHQKCMFTASIEEIILHRVKNLLLLSVDNGSG